MLNTTYPANAESAIAYYGHAGDELERVGEWQGEAARLLGLEGEGRIRDWQKLVRGKSPTGEKLAQKLGSNRRVLLDLTASANKPTAILMALADPSIRDVLEGANRALLAEVEPLMQTRVKLGPVQITVDTGSMAALPFYHDITRAREPGWHAHNTILALTPQRGKWYAPEFERVVSSKALLAAAFHNEVAVGLRRLGYQTEPTKDNFRVVGVPDSACRKLSGGKARIDAEVARREKSLQEQMKAARSPDELHALERKAARLKSPKGRAALAVVVRENKRHDLKPEKLQAEWRGKLTWGERKALDKAASEARRRHNDPWEDRSATHLANTLHGLLKAESAVPEEKLLTAALKQGVGEVSIQGLRSALDGGEYVRAKVDGVAYVATAESMGREEQLVTWAKKGAISVNRRRKDEAIPMPGAHELVVKEAEKLGLDDALALCRRADDEWKKLRLEANLRDYRKAESGRPLSIFEDQAKLRTGQQRPKPKLVAKAAKVGRAVVAKLVKGIGQFERIRRMEYMRSLEAMAHERTRDVARLHERQHSGWER